MLQSKQKLSYGLWKTEITPEKVFSDIVRFFEVKVINNAIYWLEARPSEGGRIVLVLRKPSGEIKDITPKGFYIRTRVHEYGGGAFAIHHNFVYFVNFKDQRIYAQDMSTGDIVPLTPERNADGSLGKYAALEVSPDGSMLTFVYEKEYSDRENKNFIGALDLTKKEVCEPIILAGGNDFYSNPKISPDGEHIAWLTWNHPNMPWDSTKLVLAKLKGVAIAPHSERVIAGGLKRSICQIRFGPKGDLYFVMDRVTDNPDSPENWWNLYRYNQGGIEAVTNKKAEFGAPEWRFGNQMYDFVANDKIICTFIEKGEEHLAMLDAKSKKMVPVDTSFQSFNFLQISNDQDLIFVGGSPTQVPSIVRLNLKTLKEEILKSSFPIKIDSENISIPQAIKYRTSDGKFAHAFLYLPKNKKFEGPIHEKPPLIVMVHGGPTSRTSTAMSLTKQFWTSQGYAILDVNYRGSTGYGRQYRDALLGKWGVIDANDIADGVRYLIKQGIVDANKIVIRGGSAGGYAVQRALTEFPDLFAGGASYYGIGNLETLAKETHKFESRYIDNLVGQPYSENAKLYKERSPIYHLDRLKAAMIIFQGSEDKIVTPEVSREMARSLKERGIDHEYIEYPGEAHGFRIKDNNIDSLKKEAAFYKRVLKLGH